MTSKNRSLLGIALFVPLAALLLVTFACLPAPVGDPEQSKVDDQLIGAWRTSGTTREVITPMGSTPPAEPVTSLAIIRQWDAHTYLIFYVNKYGKDGKERYSQMHFKGWLTKFGDTLFLTCQPLDDQRYVVGGDPPDHMIWCVFRLDKIATGLNVRMVKEGSDLMKEKTKREEIEAVIKENLNNDALYGEMQVFNKLGKEDQEFIDDMLSKFVPK